MVAELKIPWNRVAFVGDGMNDISSFALVGIAIAFNPENNTVTQAAKHIVVEDMRGILPLLVSTT